MPQRSLVGPFPEGSDHEEFDRRRRRILWSLPTGLYVLGSAAGGRRNLMTLNWAVQVATEPKLVAVAVESGAVTADLVTRGGHFVLNLLWRRDAALVRRFVKPLEDGGDPSLLGGAAVRDAPSGPPILEAAAAWLECRVHSRLDFGSHVLFAGEVLDCGSQPGPDPDESGGILRMEDTRMNYGG